MNSNSLLLITTRYNIISVITLLLLFGCIQSNSEGDVWYSLEDAQKKVTDNNKKVMLNIYVENNEESKKLQDEVFPDEKVTKIMDEYFCSVQIDANSTDSLMFNGLPRTGEEVAEMLGVTSYPTTIFLDKTGEKIIITSGYMKADIFATVLSYIGSDAYLTTEYDQYVDRQ